MSNAFKSIVKLLWRPLSIAILSILALLFAWVCYKAFDNTEIIRHGKIADVEIVQFVEYGDGQSVYTPDKDGRIPWVFTYRYVDENGENYQGAIFPVMATLEEAEDKIGEKITVYIDGNGGSVLYDNGLNPTLPWVYGGITIVIIAMDLYLIFFRRIHKKQ